MKTDELIRVLAQECKVRVVVTPDFNNIYCYSIYSNKNGEDDWWFKLGNLKDSQANLTINEGHCIKQYYAKTLKYIAEYLDTPLEEREEEKKYYLLFPKGIEMEDTCLYKNSKKEIFEVCVNGVKCKSHQPYVQFTQKEIDAMPKSWQDFFIKEEVK